MAPPKILPAWTRVNFIITDSLLKRLDREAQRLGSNRSQVLRKLAEEALDSRAEKKRAQART